jgi:hypothetical protein
LNQLIRLLSRNNLSVGSEKMVFDAAIRWIDYNSTERSQYFSQIMEHIRWPLISDRDLLILSEDGMVKNSTCCKQFLFEALQYKHAIKNKLNIDQINTSQLFKMRTTPRKPISLPNILFIFGGQAPKATNKVEVYDFRTQDWLYRKEMGSKRCRAGCVFFKGKIYLIGGFNGNTRLKSVDIYDPIKDTWTPGEDMVCRRGTHGVCLMNNRIYAIGGFDGITGLMSCERYDPETGKWKIIAPLIKRRSSVGVTVLNNYLYASKCFYGNLN